MNQHPRSTLGAPLRLPVARLDAKLGAASGAGSASIASSSSRAPKKPTEEKVPKKLKASVSPLAEQATMDAAATVAVANANAEEEEGERRLREADEMRVEAKEKREKRKRLARNARELKRQKTAAAAATARGVMTTNLTVEEVSNAARVADRARAAVVWTCQQPRDDEPGSTAAVDGDGEIVPSPVRRAARSRWVTQRSICM